MNAADLSGTVAVVTGGVSGMGESCTRRLVELGAAVVAIDLDDSRAEAVLGDLPDDARAHFIQTDITKPESLERVAEHVRSQHGRLDMLINCAGIFTPNARADKLPLDDFRRAFEVNCIGTVLTCQTLYPLLRENGGGGIANVASQAALVSLPEQGAYTASKGAVAALTRSFAIDWAPDNVRVNAICPGFTLTPMSEPAMTEDLKRVVGRRVPLGRIFDPMEMANVLVFLASPLASAVTGVVMAVDGGWTAGEPELPEW